MDIFDILLLAVAVSMGRDGGGDDGRHGRSENAD